MVLTTKEISKAKTTSSLNNFSVLGLVGDALTRYIGNMVNYEVGIAQAVDLNELEPWTFVYYNSGSTNSPFPGSALAFTIGASSGSKFQLVFRFSDGGIIYFRSYLSTASSWSPWRQVTNAVISGGVKRYSSISYAITLKGGGLRDGSGDERIIQLDNQRGGCGCDDVPWGMPECRHSHADWFLQMPGELPRLAIGVLASSESFCGRRYGASGSTTLGNWKALYQDYKRKFVCWHRLERACICGNHITSERRAAA